MADPRESPGPAAERAFQTGIRAAAVAALVGVGALAVAGVVTPVVAGVLVLVFVPLYLLVVACALSKWLGFDKDMTDLRPVTRRKGEQSAWERRPR